MAESLRKIDDSDISVPRLGYSIEKLYLVREYLPKILDQATLNSVQDAIFCQCWLGATYRDIAEQLGYDSSYIRLMGAQLWQLLSARLGQKVTKSNFQPILMNHLNKAQKSSQTPINGSNHISEIEIEIEPWVLRRYVERFPIEAQCYEAIVQEGALIRIKAPQEMGKTLLASQILHHAQQHSIIPVILSLRLADTETFSGLDKFLQWFCLNVGDQLNIPNQLSSDWEPCFSSSYNCTNYIERVILPSTDQAIAIVLDDVDILFKYPKLATDFFGMLRAWCEKAKHVNASSRVWRRCRFIVVHSTEVYIPLNKHQSPFNIGLSIELPAFNATQVGILAEKFDLTLDPLDILKLMDWIGGKPKLMTVVFSWIAHQRTTFAEIFNDPIQSTSLFQEHLRSQYRKLQRYADLESKFRDVVWSDESVELASVQGFQLESLGLVSLETGMRARPSCRLYRQYFRQMLE
jgi:AAA-like domain